MLAALIATRSIVPPAACCNFLHQSVCSGDDHLVVRHQLYPQEKDDPYMASRSRPEPRRLRLSKS